MTDLLSYMPQLASALSITLILMFCSTVIGFVAAVLLTLGSLSTYWVIKKPVDSLVFFVRGTPLLVQLFLIYYGTGQFEWLRASPIWVILKEPMACAIIALSLNTACYTSIIFKGAINSVPRNEIAACYALGMSKLLAMRRVVFPKALRLALPAYSNEVVIILKCTSLASTITLLDVMGMTQRLISQTYQTVTFYLLAATIYLVLNIVIMSLFKQVEKYFRV